MVEVAAAIEHAMGEAGTRTSLREPAVAAAPGGSPREPESLTDLDPAVTPVKPVIGARGLGLGAVALALVGVIGWAELRTPTPSPPVDTPTAVVASTVPVEAVTTAPSSANVPPTPVASASVAPLAPTASAMVVATPTPSAVVKKVDPPARPVVAPPRHPKSPGGGEVVDPWGH
jgi:hypothetical protein